MLSNHTKICQFFFENALNISRLGDILLLGSMDSYRASHVSVLLSPVFSAKSNENLPSLKNSFALEKEIPPQRIIVSLCLAGRFSVVLRAGSWQDLHYRVWGSVRLFCAQTPPRTQDHKLPEVPMLLYDCFIGHFLVGFPSIRQTLTPSLC